MREIAKILRTSIKKTFGKTGVNEFGASFHLAMQIIVNLIINVSIGKTYIFVHIHIIVINVNTHSECINYFNGYCRAYGMPVDPNGPACPNFKPRSAPTFRQTNFFPRQPIWQSRSMPSPYLGFRGLGLRRRRRARRRRRRGFLL